jgi:hypothetical protein
MHQLEVKQFFAAPVAKVWERYTDHRSWSGFSRLVKVKLQPEGSPDPNGVGCVRVFSTAGITAVAEEVTLFEPPARMKYRIVGGGWPLRNHEGEVLFALKDEGTLVSWRVRFDSAVPGLGPLLRLVLRGMFRFILRHVAAELDRA